MCVESGGEVAIALRERKYVPEKCQDCPELSLCCMCNMRPATKNKEEYDDDKDYRH